MPIVLACTHVHSCWCVGSRPHRTHITMSSISPTLGLVHTAPPHDTDLERKTVYISYGSYTGVFCHLDGHQHPFFAFDPEEMNGAFIGHCNGHHVLSHDNRLPHWSQARHLLDVPLSIQIPLCGKDFVLVIHEGELESRRAMSGALDLSAQMGMVVCIEKLGSTTLQRE